MEYPGDLATQLADEFQSKWLASIDADMLATLDEAADIHAEKRRSIFTKMDFRWRPQDRVMLDQIRLSSKMTMGELYDIALAIVDEFYAQMRVPEVDPQTGMNVLDAERRQVWQRNPATGNYIEDISQLTGQDIEKTILDMQRVRFVVASLHNQLLNEAILARHLYDDRYQAGYESIVEGTQGDRNARASRESRRDKYKAFFHWQLYSSSNVFMLEINTFVRMLDRMVDRRAWNGERRSS